MSENFNALIIINNNKNGKKSLSYAQVRSSLTAIINSKRVSFSYSDATVKR